ncbi:protein Lines homolog 1 isoform X3 [Calonectris borealis]|uniref:protein Lines homolog 1 isoform X3 n=1 Tax=Calonectris borealis TaxID=1323832 RepID=UPI003F4CA6C8
MKMSLLQQMYKEVLVGIPLAKESHHYTSLLNLCVEQSPERDELCNRMHLPSTDGGIRSHQDTDMSDVVVPTTDDTSNSFANMNSSFCPREVMLLQLTLIKMMVAKAESQEIEFNMRQKYCEIFVLLLKEAKIDSKLICLLGSYDQLLSHMASKSLASLVYFQLKEENTLNVTWLTFSLKTLSGFPVNTHVAECLWTLTTIIKDILKDKVLPKAGILKKLLAPLDAVLEGFYNSILFHHFDSHHYTSPYSEAANNLISFIDLLEALLASRIELELPFRCQRVLFLKVSYVLNLISSSIHYLIKKLFIMLLKKCVLCKSREDAGSGSLFLQNPSLYEDMLALSNAILQVVNLTWLNQIPLSEKASYFGGSEAPPGDDTQGGSDQTVLRALSLVVLKALEFKFQNSATEAEIKGDFQSFMSELLIFWRSHLKSSPQSHPVVHHCEWLSLIFIEQDDDMWEAAKALLLIYLKFDRLRHDAANNLSQKEEETWNFLTHASGYNPHCIFLFFLEKIAFDSTVLLDFLISSETCFLEYLHSKLRYLKDKYYESAAIIESMAHILKTLNSWFWWENIWMPVNVTWAHFVDRDGLVFPKPHQLYATIPYAIVLLIIRFFSERYVAIPLAKALGIKNVRRVKPQPNPVLESYFRECSKHPSQSEIQGLAKKCNCTVRLVEKWFRRRRNLEIPTVLRKFQEALNRGFTTYGRRGLAIRFRLYCHPNIGTTWLRLVFTGLSYLHLGLTTRGRIFWLMSFITWQPLG